MMSLLMESVVVAFALGGVFGAVVAVHLLYRSKEFSRLSNHDEEVAEDLSLIPRRVPVRVKIPPRS